MALPITTRGPLLWAIPPLLIAVLVAYFKFHHPAIDGGSSQCAALSAALNDKVSYPASTVYSQSSSSYWSKQEASLAPTCIVTPINTDDVVSAIRTLALADKNNGFPQPKFAIRGGGHTPWAGSASIDGGVTIDMRVC